MTYNAEDQLLSVGSATYQYDTDGFLSKKTDGALVTTYNYSSAGELLSASLPDGRTLEYIYDPQGRRITKKVNSLVVEKYLWAGLTQLLAVYDGADSLVMRFEYSDARVPNAMVKSGTTYYLSYDQVGSLRAVYDATGALVKRIDYDSFGNILVDTNPAFSLPFGFAGGLDDRDTNLVHFGFRDYDPSTGRWTAKDPIGFGGGDVDLYGYVESDPVNWTDKDGLSKGGKQNIWGDDPLMNPNKLKDILQALQDLLVSKERKVALKAWLKVFKRGGAMAIAVGALLTGDADAFDPSDVDPAEVEPDYKLCLDHPESCVEFCLKNPDACKQPEDTLCDKNKDK